MPVHGSQGVRLTLIDILDNSLQVRNYLVAMVLEEPLGLLRVTLITLTISRVHQENQLSVASN
jgi:hypothetical protein